ncbi:MAG: hypothetical protein ABIA93_05555 [Candidatus Woesearchaeota archaeon]
MKTWITLFVLLLISASAEAAVIHGNVYDLALNKVEDAIVTIDTTPAQRVVAVNGEYSFTVQEGTYILKAVQYEDIAQELVRTQSNETITVGEEGDYLLDLILFPTVDLSPIDIGDINESGVNFGDTIKGNNTKIWIIAIIAAIIIAGLALYVSRRKEKPTVQEDDEILNYIKKEKRTTQNEIRKQFPYSEAKISLTISDLEAQGKIRKIKKGRANIIAYHSKP